MSQDSWGTSALLIEKHSAHTGFWQPAPLQLYDGLGKDTLVEGCPGVEMRFVRFFQLGQPDSIQLEYVGAAENGVDVNSLPQWVYFAPGQDTTSFTISPLNDTLTEGIEQLTIRLMPPGEYECPVDTTEVDLWIADRPPLQAVIADTFFFNPCANDSIRIGPSIAGGLQPLSYLWNTGATTDSITVAPVNNAAYSLTIYDACQFDSVVLTTVTRQAPAPVIELINADSIINCNQGLLPIGFEVVENYYPQFEYKWAGGQTDSIIYVNPLHNGSYTYNFKILRPCMPDSFAFSIDIHVQNDPVVVDIDDIEADHCPGHAYDLTPDVSGGYPPYTFAWNTGEVVKDIQVAPLVSDTYFFSVTDACGIDTIVTPVRVAVPHYDSLSITGPTQINLPCPVGYVTILEGDYLGKGGLPGTKQEHYNFSWNNWQSTKKALQFYTEKDTLLTLRMRDTCGVDEAVLEVPVTVFKGPFLSLDLPDTIHGCLNEPVVLRTGAKDGVKPYEYQWTGGVADSLFALIPDQTHTPVMLTVTDACDDRQSAEVVVSATQPTAAFSAYNDTYDPLLFQFENQSQGAVYYTWYFGNQNQSLEVDPMVRLQDLSETQVKLVVGDEFGCLDSTEQKLDIPLHLFIPNSFTPNGDGMNDTWQPLGFGFETLHYTIYDRWGNALLTCGLPSCFDWDGRVDGKLLPADSYSYLLIVRGLDGKKQQVRGVVNVVR